MRRTAIALALGAALTGAAMAVTPDEMLADPALEARAREISAHLRCMVCQNQSIDDSDADLARDLRVIVRERLLAGDSNDEVLAYLESRYGEFVLLKPRLSARNALLWGAPVIMLALGGIYLLRRGRSQTRPAEALTSEEKARLDAIMSREGDA